LVDHHLPIGVAQLVVGDTRHAMGLVAASFLGHPSRRLTMIGVTGTNGKTTTTSLIGSVLRAAGRSTGVIGTLTGVHTTPESPDLQRQLADFVAGGTTTVVMEVSSHALELQRVAGCRFDVAVFTNLGRDHLDLHGTEERYFAAKAKLFQPDLSDFAIVNIDDPRGQLLRDVGAVPTEGFGLADIDDVSVSTTSHSYTWRGQRIEVPLGGEFNVMNSLAAATTCAHVGMSEEAIRDGLRHADAVPGRFEAIEEGQPFAVVVDYAHTPEGLGQALGATRRVAGTGAVHVVFGCGGDRDREKRPVMGGIAAELADHVVLTSDNPRSEDPLEIINAALAGVPPDYRGRVVIEPDRRKAIDLAFRQARPGDVVLIAGKGHETTQSIGGRELPFDDRVVARQLLRALA
jgi:UDP-N-acetylmuramoyl-L-alanyl-D-glutamate--2,6-diaminopimelate ligase